MGDTMKQQISHAYGINVKSCVIVLAAGQIQIYIIPKVYGYLHIPMVPKLQIFF